MNFAEPPRRSESPWRFALLTALPAAILLLLLVATQRADPDLWGRISVGAVLFQAGHLPMVDDFSYTAAGGRWIDHEWLTGVLFYGLLSVAGEPGLTIFKYGMAALPMLLVFAAQRSAYRSSPLYATYALALLSPAYLTAYVSTVRAQVFSIAFFLLSLAILERVRLRQWPVSRLLWLVPLAVLWGNLHGGFVMGAMAVGLYGLAEALFRRYADAAIHLGLAAAMLGAVGVVNPYGSDYLGFLVHAWTLDRSGITEWQPMLSGPWTTGWRYLGVVLLVAAGLGGLGLWRAWARRRADRRSAPRAGTDAGAADGALAPALVLLLVVAMTLLARRFHSFMALTLAFYLPLFVDPAVERLRPSTARRTWAGIFELWIPLTVCAAAATLLSVGLAGRPILRTVVLDERARGAEERFKYPLGAVRYLQNSPYRGRLLNPFTQGQFLYWTLYPKFRIAIDGRYEEVYTQEQFRRVERFYRQSFTGRPEAAAALADESGADFILFRSRQRGSVEAVARSRSWRLLYDDGSYALVGRVETLERYLPYRPSVGRLRKRATIESFFAPASPRRFATYPRTSPEVAGAREGRGALRELPKPPDPREAGSK